MRQSPLSKLLTHPNILTANHNIRSHLVHSNFIFNLAVSTGGVGNEDPCPIRRWWVQHSSIMSTSMQYRPNKLCLTLSHALGIRDHYHHHFHLLHISTNLRNKLGFKKGNQIYMFQFQPGCATRELGIVLSMALFGSATGIIDLCGALKSACRVSCTARTTPQPSLTF